MFPENLAYKKQVKQSSTYSEIVNREMLEYPAENAVNGIIFGEREFSHTEGGAGQWWRVDLGSVQPVSIVELYNRNGLNCKSILRHIWMFNEIIPLNHQVNDILLVELCMQFNFLQQSCCIYRATIPIL